MKFLSKLFFTSSIICFISVSVTFGQIKAIDADASVATSYMTADSTFDTIYVYNYNQFETIDTGKFEVRSPFKGKATFDWNRYDSISKKFVTLSKTDSGVDSSLFKTAIGGGYKVDISTVSFPDTSITFWFYPHKINILVEDGKAFVKGTCSYVDLEATVTTDTFTYYNPDSTKPLTLIPDLSGVWTANPTPESALPAVVKPSFSIRNNNPPYKDTEYILTVTDNFNYSFGDSVKYVAVKPKADFSAISASDSSDVIEIEKSAPLRVKFTNLSENGNKYTWYMGEKDTVITTSTEAIMDSFYTSGTYRILLHVKNTYTTCIDTISKNLKVHLPEIAEDNDKEKFPNYFFPGNGEIFQPIHLSIKKYSFVIVSRWGKVAYKESGYDMDKNFKGWDGKIGGSDATEGIYYYILTVEPFDKTRNGLSDVYKGFVYLYR